MILPGENVINTTLCDVECNIRHSPNGSILVQAFVFSDEPPVMIRVRMMVFKSMQWAGYMLNFYDHGRAYMDRNPITVIEKYIELCKKIG